MNKAFFIGNLTRDPETKMMSNGKPRCTFTIAVSRTYTNAQGGRGADFISVTCYDKRAETAQKYLAKGRKVSAVCHVKTGSYEKDDGHGGKQRIYTTEFVLDELEFLSQKSSADNAQMADGQQPDYPPQDNSGFTEVDDDELPF